MSIAEKATAIKEVVSLVVSVIPKLVDLIVEVISAVRDFKTA